jgi:hypothetical protein
MQLLETASIYWNLSLEGHLQSNLHAANQNVVGGLLLKGVPIVSLVITYGVTLL